jgi:hypothetical protein
MEPSPWNRLQHTNFPLTHNVCEPLKRLCDGRFKARQPRLEASELSSLCRTVTQQYWTHRSRIEAFEISKIPNPRGEYHSNGWTFEPPKQALAWMNPTWRICRSDACRSRMIESPQPTSTNCRCRSLYKMTSRVLELPAMAEYMGTVREYT